jgi:hypothetical protein
MAKRFLENQGKDKKMESTFSKTAKKRKVQRSKTNPKTSPILDTSQQMLYEYIENKEMVGEEPPVSNDTQVLPEINISGNDLPATKGSVNKDIPANTNPEAGQPLMPEDDLLTVSNFMMTSLLRRRENQITKLKNEMQEMKIVEKVMKSESESIKSHSRKTQEENEQF